MGDDEVEHVGSTRPRRAAKGHNGQCDAAHVHNPLAEIDQRRMLKTDRLSPPTSVGLPDRPDPRSRSLTPAVQRNRPALPALLNVLCGGTR
jgi:hypothetical protein